MSVDTNVLKPLPAGIALSEHDALPAGTRFGEFEIIRALGVGGFGIVYLAQDHSLERQVALKEYMPATLAARGAGPMITIRAPSFAETYAVGLRSFINEARLLARFDHPSLVKVYRFWEDNGTAYMVMPYLQGRTVRDARRAMGRTPDEAWIRAVLDPMLDALELLHREGVYHRDVAPDNILLPNEGAPILLDFGAARRVISNRDDNLTAILKPNYAPIEQYAEMASLRQGPWTDIYALGAVLHFLLFGVPPAPATARAVEADLTGVARRHPAGISPRLVRVMDWMLGVRPLERPQTIGAVRAALAGALDPPAAEVHELTRPMVAARPAAGYEQTTVDSGHAATRVAPGWGETLAAPRRPPTAAPSAAGAPLRSTPPGSPPPAYVPPPRVAVPSLPSTPVPMSAPAGNVGSPPAASPIPVAVGWRTAWTAPSRLVWPLPPRRKLAGGLGAAVVGVAMLWQFSSLLSRPTAEAKPLGAVPTLAAGPAAAASPPPVAAATLPALPPPSASAASPAVLAAAPVDDAPVSSPSSVQAATGLGPAVPVPGPASVGTDEVDLAPNPGVHRGAAVRRAAAVTRPHRLEALRDPATAREACGNRTFLALAMCLDRQCQRPQFRNEPSCERMLQARRRRSGEY